MLTQSALQAMTLCTEVCGFYCFIILQLTTDSNYRTWRRVHVGQYCPVDSHTLTAMQGNYAVARKWAFSVEVRLTTTTYGGVELK